MRVSYIILSSLLILTSCGVGNKLITKTIEKLGTNDEGILFITVFFRQTEFGGEAFDLKARWTNGTLKHLDRGEGDFVCTVEGVDEKVEIYFESPLSTSFEEYGENGELRRVQVNLKEAEHTFRINYDGGERLVIIYDQLNQREIGQFKIK